MNYLAHALLSGDDPLVLVGNMCGDSLVGGTPREMPDAVRQGLHLHFEIDRMTDTSPEFRTCVAAFHSRFGRFSHIIVDLSFDYILANDWDRYCERSLDKFVDWVYATLDENRALFLGNFETRFDRMREYDWLRNYRRMEGIERALQRVAMRLKRTRPNTLHIAKAIEENLRRMTEGFESLFPRLQQLTFDDAQAAD